MGSFAFGASVRVVMGHGDGDSQDTQWMNTPSSSSWPLTCFQVQSITDYVRSHLQIPLPAESNTDHWPLQLWIDSQDAWGTEEHPKTDDSISIITKARFNLLSIQSVASLPSQRAFLWKFKTPFCLSRLSHLNQFRSNCDGMLDKKRVDCGVKPND